MYWCTCILYTACSYFANKFLFITCKGFLSVCAHNYMSAFCFGGRTRSERLEEKNFFLLVPLRNVWALRD